MMLEPLTSLVVQQIRLTNSYEVGPALHRRVLEAVRDGNSVGARQAARRLMRFTLEHTRKAIELFEASVERETAAPRSSAQTG